RCFDFALEFGRVSLSRKRADLLPEFFDVLRPSEFHGQSSSFCAMTVKPDGTDRANGASSASRTHTSRRLCGTVIGAPNSRRRNGRMVGSPPKERWYTDAAFPAR